jgi:chorismate mutase / prephenate dehydratase
MARGMNDKNEWETLANHRREIDRIDEQIISLLSKRQEEGASVGEIKRSLGVDLFDAAREKEVLDRLCSNANERLTPEAIINIYSEIISVSRSVQETLKVAFLGPEANFTHQAALSLFGHSATFEPAGSVEEIFDMVDKGICRHGVLAIENAFEGSVDGTLDYFCNYELKICSEILVRIRHHLMSNVECIENIKILYSHPMAAAQCRAWITNHLPKATLREVESTSLAARMAADEPEAAALGSNLSASTYGLKILAEDIEDHPDNVTRFVAIGKTDAQPTGRDKTSLLFSVKHSPGTLYKVLENLARKKINMCRIESRPIRVRSWEYLFFVDIEGHSRDRDVRTAMKKMEECCVFFRQLGSYPVAKNPWP